MVNTILTLQTYDVNFACVPVKLRVLFQEIKTGVSTR